MRQRFNLLMSLLFWLIMVIGFSDNWLFDVQQSSNSEPKFLIHAGFAFCWFTILVVQAALVRSRKVRVHQSLGITGMIVYAGFALSTIYLYYLKIAAGRVAALTVLNMALFCVGTLLIVQGFLARKTNTETHRTNIVFGSFLLMEPGISRAVGHLFGKDGQPIWLLTYLILFGMFVWYHRRIKWQVAVGFGTWLAGTVYLIVQMAK